MDWLILDSLARRTRLAGEAVGYVSANGVWTFWQSTTQDEGYSYGWGMSCNDDRFAEGLYYKSHALPVRCVRN